MCNMHVESSICNANLKEIPYLTKKVQQLLGNAGNPLLEGKNES